MRAPVVLLAIASTAQADPRADGIHEVAESSALPPPADADPFLHLDAHLRLTIDNLDSRIERVERSFQLGRRGRLVLVSDWRQIDHDISVRGWRTAVGGSYDLGPVTVATHIGVEHVDTDLGRATLRTASIAVGKAFRLSPSVHGWFGVAAGQRRWVGKPPPVGEWNASYLMLSTRLTY
jgi:hypothetical protein